MKKTLLLICLYVFVVHSHLLAQDDNIFNRINGTRMKYNLYLRYNPKAFNQSTKFECYLDRNRDAGWQTLDNIDYFNVKNDFLNDFKIYMQFYNPLKYALNSTVSDVADPTYNSINEFMSQLTKTTVKPVVVTQNTLTNKAIAITRSNVNAPVNTYSQSVLLSEWLLFLYDNLNIAIMKSDTVSSKGLSIASKKSNGKKLTPNEKAEADSTKALKANLSKFADLQQKISLTTPIENYLYNGVQINSVKGKKTVSAILKEKMDSLYSAEAYSYFMEKLEEGRKATDELKLKKDTAIADIKTLTDLFTSGYDANIAPLLSASPDQLKWFKTYTAAIAARLQYVTANDLDANDEIIGKFDSLIIKLRKFTDDYTEWGTEEMEVKKDKYKNKYKLDYDMKLTWKDEKMETAKYTMTMINTDGSINQEKTSDCEFTVAKKLTFYSFISTGILYTNFSYPIYKLDGSNTIVHADDEKVNLRPAVFLNMLITNWDPIYPFIQLGATTGKNDLLVPLGIGFTLNNQLSISGGAMLGYRKELNKLAVGNVVPGGDAALTADLTNKAVASWYFSINYNLGKN